MTYGQEVDGFKIMVEGSACVQEGKSRNLSAWWYRVEGTETGCNYVEDACSMASGARAIRKRGTDVSLRAGSYSPLLEKSRYARFM